MAEDIGKPPSPEESRGRIKELRVKEGDLSREEGAELLGLIAFPDDPEGAELQTKQALGTITPKEHKTLLALLNARTKPQ